MADTRTEVFISQFAKEFNVAFRQSKSLLRDSVKYYSGVGESINIPTIGNVTAQVGRGRFTNGTFTEPAQAQVNVSAQPVEAFDRIASLDPFQSNVDFRKSSIDTLVSAINVRIDQLIIAALAATAETETALPTANTMNKQGVVKMASVLNAKNVDQGDRTLVISSPAWEDMMNDTTLTSSDFMVNKALNDGYFSNVAGFGKIVQSNYLTATSDTDYTGREAYAFHKRDVALFSPKEFSVSIDKNADAQYWVICVAGLYGAKLVHDEIAWSDVSDV